MKHVTEPDTASKPTLRAGVSSEQHLQSQLPGQVVKYAKFLPWQMSWQARTEPTPVPPDAVPSQSSTVFCKHVGGGGSVGLTSSMKHVTEPDTASKPTLRAGVSSEQ